MSTCNTKTLCVRFASDVLFKNEEQLNAFLENHTSVRSIYVESDNGELTKIDLELTEIEEIVDLTEEDE